VGPSRSAVSVERAPASLSLLGDRPTRGAYRDPAPSVHLPARSVGRRAGRLTTGAPHRPRQSVPPTAGAHPASRQSPVWPNRSIPVGGRGPNPAAGWSRCLSATKATASMTSCNDEFDMGRISALMTGTAAFRLLTVEGLGADSSTQSSVHIVRNSPPLRNRTFSSGRRKLQPLASYGIAKLHTN
jgi:hypothetical protein